MDETTSETSEFDLLINEIVKLSFNTGCQIYRKKK